MKEQLREREHAIHELERKIEEAQRELHAIRLESEAVCFTILLLYALSKSFVYIDPLLFTWSGVG